MVEIQSANHVWTSVSVKDPAANQNGRVGTSGKEKSQIDDMIKPKFRISECDQMERATAAYPDIKHPVVIPSPQS